MLSSLACAMCFVAAPVLTGCNETTPSTAGEPSLGVTTSYIECAVRDLAPEEFQIVRLLPPGGCPGHFDVTPRMIDRLRSSALLFRFDFQGALDTKLKRVSTSGLKIIPVPVSSGLSVPSTYETVCQAVCEALCAHWPEKAVRFRVRLESIRARLADLSDESRQRVASAGMAGVSVLSSQHQEAFCQWLGLTVSGTFPRGDEAVISQYAASLEAGEKGRVTLIVANIQEGLDVAQMLSKRLSARLVVLSNFPSMAAGQQTFDDLFRTNVAAVLGRAATAPHGVSRSASAKDGAS